jgi:hypothetical protein
MRSETIIYLKWKLSGRIEFFVNLGKLYSYYTDVELGVSRHTLNKKDLSIGYENGIIEVRKVVVFS